MISREGETLPDNPRASPPLPPQEDMTDTLLDDWKQYTYHTALGSYACLFVDDVLCFSKTEEEHLRHLRQICMTLRQHKLYLNPAKCTICQPEIVYLGNRVGRYGVRPTPDRLEALQNWPAPQSVEELQSFLGLIGFLRRYIADMAQIAVPLNRLLRKKAVWQWGMDQQKAFEKLKERCTKTPVLAIPSAEADLVVRCDASREAMGAALYQKDSDGYLQPIEFKSKAFAEPQKRLPAHDREGLALLFVLKSFRHFLLHQKFEVQTDNAALSQIFTSKDMSDLYARWYWKIAEFPGLTIRHRPGRKLYCADALSRRPTAPQDDTTPFYVEPGQLFKVSNEGTTAAWQMQLIKDGGHHYSVKISDASVASAAATVVAPEEVCGQSAGFKGVQIEASDMQQYRESWPALYQQDEEFKALWKENGSDKWGFFKHDGLLWKFGPSGPRLCVPKSASKVSLLEAVHDCKLASHAGKHRTLARAIGNYYWRGMYGDVARYVSSCHVCQLSKIDRRARQGEPKALPVPELPWDMVHMDWITGLPRSPQGNDAVLVFVCALTGMVHLKACKKSDTAMDTAKHFVSDVVRLHGMPKTVVSDRDIRLRAHFWRALQKRLGTELRFTTAYTPNTNGKVERVNAVLGDVLRSVCKFAGRDWEEQLDLAEFAINGSESQATGFTPFYANYAREPRVPATLTKPTMDVPAAEDFADAMFATITHTRDAMERAKRKYERENPGRRRAAEAYKPGDKVLLSTKNLQLKVRSRKLLRKYVGPLEVMQSPKEDGNPNVVYLKVPKTLKIQQPINVKDIKRYVSRDDDLGGEQDEMPEPIVVDGEDRYEVEAVVAERLQGRRRQVLVKWRGVDLLSASWEPIENIPQMFLDDFYGLQHNDDETDDDTTDNDET